MKSKTNNVKVWRLLLGWSVTGPNIHVMAFWRDKLVLYRVTETPRARWYRLVRWVKFIAQFAQVWNVYFIERSRDCDHVEATYRHRFPTYWHAHRYIMRAYEDAEGPKSFTQVNRKQYNEFKPEWRDRMLEAFEDGMGTHTSIP